MFYMDKPRDHNVLNTRTLKINYEFILDIDAERQNARDMIEFGNMQSRYDNLKSEEQVLDKLFDQTKYGKQVEELAVKLADELITNLSQGKDISDTVQNITTGFPKQEVSATKVFEIEISEQLSRVEKIEAETLGDVTELPPDKLAKVNPFSFQ